MKNQKFFAHLMLVALVVTSVPADALASNSLLTEKRIETPYGVSALDAAASQAKAQQMVDKKNKEIDSVRYIGPPILDTSFDHIYRDPNKRDYTIHLKRTDREIVVGDAWRDSTKGHYQYTFNLDTLEIMITYWDGGDKNKNTKTYPIGSRDWLAAMEQMQNMANQASGFVPARSIQAKQAKELVNFLKQVKPPSIQPREFSHVILKPGEFQWIEISQKGSILSIGEFQRNGHNARYSLDLSTMKITISFDGTRVKDVVIGQEDPRWAETISKMKSIADDAVRFAEKNSAAKSDAQHFRRVLERVTKPVLVVKDFNETFFDPNSAKDDGVTIEKKNNWLRLSEFSGQNIVAPPIYSMNLKTFSITVSGVGGGTYKKGSRGWLLAMKTMTRMAQSAVNYSQGFGNSPKNTFAIEPRPNPNAQAVLDFLVDVSRRFGPRAVTEKIQVA